jgi:D-sedoheptulose 7-phosphate isomerase
MFSKKYFKDISIISSQLDTSQVDILAKSLKKIRGQKGRIFFLGIGGSAGNCSHAVNDFRKLCNIESYSPIDNVSELSARINDEGWKSSFSNWLLVSNLNAKDCLFIMSVGGGNKKKKVSENLIEAIKLAKNRKAKIFGIVGHNGGYTARNSDISIKIPKIDKNLITPYTESFQAVVWHCLVSHPLLKVNNTKW